MDWLTGSKQGEVKKLISQLGDSTKRDSAAKNLIGLGAEAVPALIDALQTQDLGLAHTCEQILARIPSASPLMIKALQTAHPLIRGRVAEVFAINKDQSAMPALVDALKGEFYTVRARAALALGNMGDQRILPNLLPLLKDNEFEVRIAACTAIGKFKLQSTFDDLANILLDDPKIEARQAAATALGETRNPAALPILMDALRDSFWWFEKDQSVTVLLNAIENLGSDAVPHLIEALADKEGTVRKYAAQSLGKLGDIRAIEELGMTIYDLHHEVGKVAAHSLAKFGAKAVDMLIEALKHPEPGIRENAVLALGTIQDIRVAPALIEVLNDSNRDVQINALQTLATIKDQRVLPVLQQLSTNRTDRELAGIARQLLEKITDR